MGNKPQENEVPATEPVSTWQAEARGETSAPAGTDKGVWIGVGILVAFVLAALVAVALFQDSPKPAPSAAGVSYTPSTRTVTYEASGEETEAGSYTIRSDDGGTRQGEADLPLMNKTGGYGLVFTGFASGDFVYISVQNANGYGAVTCKIIVDGEVISENTSTGGYAIATCSSQVP